MGFFSREKEWDLNFVANSLRSQLRIDTYEFATRVAGKNSRKDGTLSRRARAGAGLRLRLRLRARARARLRARARARQGA
jgi:hypothetical protein